MKITDIGYLSVIFCLQFIVLEQLNQSDIILIIRQISILRRVL